MSAYVVEQRLPNSGLAANRDWRGDTVFLGLEQAEMVAERVRELWSLMGAEARVFDLDTGAVVSRT